MELIKEKFSRPELEEIDMKAFMEYENIGGTLKPRNIPENPIINNEFIRFSQSLRSRYQTEGQRLSFFSLGKPSRIL